MTRIRQQNVTAARWSSNGEALGTVDLTEEKNNAFGANVFAEAVQKDRLSRDAFKKLQAAIETGEGLDTELAGRGRRGDEGVGARARRDPLHARLPAADRPHRREARLVLRARRRGRRGRRLLGQGADPGRARRLLVPDRRRPGDVRGPRLHGLGSRPAPRSSSRTPTARCSASPRRSPPGRARRWTRRSRCCARWTRSRARRSTPCASSATRSHSASSRPSVPSRSTS